MKNVIIKTLAVSAAAILAHGLVQASRHSTSTSPARTPP